MTGFNVRLQSVISARRRESTLAQYNSNVTFKISDG
jgi:hypothetical protein